MSSTSAPADEAAPITRPIFFYNSSAEIGQMLGLNLFEPRYRIMIARMHSAAPFVDAMVSHDPPLKLPGGLDHPAIAGRHRHSQFIYLPNYVDYQPKQFHVGYLAELVQPPQPRISRDQMQSGSLPMWGIQAQIVSEVVLLAHWEEAGTGGLFYGRAVRTSLLRPAAGAALRLSTALRGAGKACTQHIYARPSPMFTPMFGDMTGLCVYREFPHGPGNDRVLDVRSDLFEELTHFCPERRPELAAVLRDGDAVRGRGRGADADPERPADASGRPRGAEDRDDGPERRTGRALLDTHELELRWLRVEVGDTGTVGAGAAKPAREANGRREGWVVESLSTPASVADGFVLRLLKPERSLAEELEAATGAVFALVGRNMAARVFGPPRPCAVGGADEAAAFRRAAAAAVVDGGDAPGAGPCAALGHVPLPPGRVAVMGPRPCPAEHTRRAAGDEPGADGRARRPPPLQRAVPGVTVTLSEGLGRLRAIWIRDGDADAVRSIVRRAGYAWGNTAIDEGTSSVAAEGEPGGAGGRSSHAPLDPPAREEGGRSLFQSALEEEGGRSDDAARAAVDGRSVDGRSVDGRSETAKPSEAAARIREASDWAFQCAVAGEFVFDARPAEATDGLGRCELRARSEHRLGHRLGRGGSSLPTLSSPLGSTAQCDLRVLRRRGRWTAESGPRESLAGGGETADELRCFAVPTPGVSLRVDGLLSGLTVVAAHGRQLVEAPVGRAVWLGRVDDFRHRWAHVHGPDRDPERLLLLPPTRLRGSLDGRSFWRGADDPSLVESLLESFGPTAYPGVESAEALAGRIGREHAGTLGAELPQLAVIVRVEGSEMTTLPALCTVREADVRGLERRLLRRLYRGRMRLVCLAQRRRGPAAPAEAGSPRKRQNLSGEPVAGADDAADDAVDDAAGRGAAPALSSELLEICWTYLCGARAEPQAGA